MDYSNLYTNIRHLTKFKLKQKTNQTKKTTLRTKIGKHRHTKIVTLASFDPTIIIQNVYLSCTSHEEFSTLWAQEGP